MAKGNWELPLCSLETGDAWDMVDSGPNMELEVVPGGRTDVGEGKTSLNLEGSFLSAFQIPVPHGKEPAGRPIMAAEAECEPQSPPVASVEGVPGCEVVGDMELLANEPFLGRGTCCDVSFSHEARRTGLWGGATGCVGSGTRPSASSSELAKGSDSGVNVRLSLSNRMDWLEGGTDESPGWPTLEGVLGLTAAELMSFTLGFGPGVVDRH